jgi:pimeloyl-ACP methyl ester carboxylesterase
MTRAGIRFRRSCGALSLAAVVALAGCSSSETATQGAAASAPPGAPTTANPTTAAESTTTPAVTEPATTEPTTTEPAVSIPEAVVATIDSPKWSACKDATLPGLECASVKVPLDHAQPNGPTLDLALSRAKADGTKRGSMLINPGGPGASGVEYTNSVANRMPKEIRDAYDIIGFDPRGTGRSIPVDCVDDAYLDRSAEVDPTPDTPEEREAMRADNLEAACLAKITDIDVYATTRVAQDMDALRAALGDDLLTYYGVSYGSYLGAVYATMFPNKVGSMVLDGAFLPETSGDESSIVQWGGFNKAFSNWATWCEQEPQCAFNAPDVEARYNKLVDAMEAKPLKVGTRTAGEGAVLGGTIASLYSKSTWAVFAAALAQAENGDAAGLVALFDGYSQRNPADGKYSPLTESNTIINCASGITRPITGGDEFITKMRALGPLGRFVDSEIDPTKCNTPLPTISYSGAKPIIVIGGENDPATPYSQALTLTKALGSKASLITFTGEGHGGLFASTCAKAAAVKYYLDGVAPGNINCAQAEPAQQPEWLAKLEFPEAFSEIPIDEGAAFLGLDSSLFASRTFRFEGSGAEANKQLQQFLAKNDFTTLTDTEIPELPESRIGAQQRGPDIALLATFGPKGFETQDLNSLSPLARSVKTKTLGSLVVVAVPINEEALKQLG